MLTKRGIIFTVVYFLMFPACFQISKLLEENWLSYINNSACSFYMFFLWIIVSGVLAGAFIIIMMTLHRAIAGICSPGKWVSIVIAAINILFTLSPAINVSSEIIYDMFYYLTSRSYMILLVMLLFFIVVDICRNNKGKDKK